MFVTHFISFHIIITYNKTKPLDMLNMGHPTNLDVAAGLVDRSRKFLHDMVLWEANGMGI